MYHVITLIFLICFVIYLKSWWRNRIIQRQLGHLPGPPCVPLLGSSYIFLGKSYSEILDAFHRISTAYGSNGSPVLFFLGAKPFIILNQPDHAQTILNSAACLDKPWIYRYTPLEGIFSLSTKKWRIHRKAIQPSFNWGILKTFLPIFRAKVDVLVRKLKDQSVSHGVFDVYGHIAACTLDMVYATTLGIEMNIQQQASCEYLDVLDELFELVTNRVTNVLLHPDWIYRWTTYYRRERHARQIFKSPAQQVLRQKPILLSETKASKTNLHKPQIFIDQLYQIAAKDSYFTKEVIEKELNTMIFGGNETTAVTMANVLLLIAMHPNVQRKLVTEIDELFGDNLQDITIEDLQQLVYMEAVLKEAMRLWPITTILGRRTSADVLLDGLSIPTGVNLVIDVFSIHRNSRYWGDDADRFVPERFLDRPQYPYAFLGFSAGPRNCIGTRYAWLSMKVMLTTILWHLELKTALRMKDIRLKVAMTLKVENKHLIGVNERRK
ncbi:cytochrome P450 4c21-like [Armigeres subalbatus]|uniref:cytochrome P450 4c21-like n=1 Tax=Armigeres subalbatus TaxID=124917 RepID=UPI002ED48957